MAGQTIINLGTGGADLNGTSGSTTGSDSNDPKWLDWPGDNAGSYVYLPGVAGNALTTADSTPLDITGDIDIRVHVAMDDWTPAAIQTLVAKYASGVGTLSYLLDVNTSGTLRFLASSNGSSATVNASSTVATGVTDGSAKWVRVTYATASGNVIFYTSDNGSTWSQLGTTVAATAGAIYNSTAALYVGSRSDNATNPAAGKFYRVMVLNGIAGTTALDIDCSVLTSGSATSFTEQSSNAASVTINRSSAGRKSVAVVSPVWLFGTDDYMEVADNALLDIGASDSFHLLAIVRVWATPVAYGRFVEKWDYSAANDPGYQISFDATTNAGLYVVDSAGDSAQRVLAYTSGAAAVSHGYLNRATAKINSGWGNTYGSEVSSSAVGSLSNTRALRIGRAIGAGGYQDFELIGMALFRRVLSTTEIASIVTYYQSRLT